MSALTEHFKDESECDESHKYHIQFVESGKHSTIPFQSPKQPFHFVALFIQLSVVFPRIKTALLRRHYRIHSHFHCLLSVRIAFIRPVHQQRNFGRLTSHLAKEFSPLRRVVRVPRRQRELHCLAIFGSSKHRNLCIPASARSSDGLRAVFLARPFHRGELLRSCYP